MLKFWSGTAEKNSGAVSIIVNFIGHKLNQTQTARVQTGLEVIRITSTKKIDYTYST